MTKFPLPYNIGTKAAPIPGEIVSGDKYLIKESDREILIVVADGLGHGKDAAFAAEKLMEIIQDSNSYSLDEIIIDCDTGLQGTNGVVLSLIKMNLAYQVEWLGIGNVAAICIQGRKHKILLPQGGVVGSRLPALHISRFEAAPHNTFILATDGISDKFIQEWAGESQAQHHLSPQLIATEIFDKYHTGKDDALVLALRWMTPHG